MNVLIAVTGSIAAYKVCEVISALRKKGVNVTCLLSKAGAEFITPLTLKSLSQNRVYREMFSEEAKVSEPLHTSLADSADLLLICPASADVIAKMAAGIADDIVTCVALSTKAPVLIAAAMNDNMWKHPITQENISKLRSIGHEFVQPIKGHLVCGREGVGHIADLETILKVVEKHI